MLAAFGLFTTFFLPQLTAIFSFFFFRPVRVIRFISEETIEEGIYSIATEKLKLEQDLSAEDNDDDKVDKRSTKRDVSRLLKLALDVEMTDDKIGEVDTVFTELESKKNYTVLQEVVEEPKMNYKITTAAQQK